MKADIHHAPYPIGPVGVPTESHLFFNQMIMKYTKYPQAAKEFLRFMMEKEQFDPG
jgi:multiple sugar transport system substrate-binding protein